MILILSFMIAAGAAMYLMGHYLYRIASKQPVWGDRFFKPLENKLFKVLQIEQPGMNWKHYFLAILGINGVVAVLGFIMLLAQGIFSGTEGMSVSLALNTVISFITNTNLQHYAGETMLTQGLQQVVIMTQMFVSAASGIAVGMAFMRGLTGSALKMGNAYQDVIRITLRVLLPFSFVMGLVLVAQGVPQTATIQVAVNTITQQTQIINMGPMAGFEAIKHFGTNGGGFFAANSAMPFENPNLISNFIEMLAMVTVPGGMVFAFGLMVKHRKQTSPYYGSQSSPLLFVALVLFVIGFVVMLLAETSGNPVFTSMGLNSAVNLEGKELRFGILDSSLFSAISTAFTTGSVNSMHDSLTPMGSFVPLLFMMLNVVFGGSGVGLMNLIIYVLLTVFICGLMIGRTPEYLGKKVESQEMKRVALVILIQPLLILGLTALALVMKQGMSGEPYHSLTQVLYEFTSATANNGSGMEGLIDNTLFWNLTTALAMLIGRYASMALQLNIANRLWEKQEVSESVGTLHTNTPVFAVTLLVIVVVISALTFFPVLMLGPIAEQLRMVVRS